MVIAKIFGWLFTLAGLFIIFLNLPDSDTPPAIALTIIFIGIVVLSIGIFLLKI